MSCERLSFNSIKRYAMQNLHTSRHATVTGLIVYFSVRKAQVKLQNADDGAPGPSNTIVRCRLWVLDLCGTSCDPMECLLMQQRPGCWTRRQAGG